MTALDVRIRLDHLTTERDQARRTGFRDNDFFMDALDDELAATRDAYVGFAVTEIATLRGQHFGRQFG